MLMPGHLGPGGGLPFSASRRLCQFRQPEKELASLFLRYHQQNLRLHGGGHTKGVPHLLLFHGRHLHMAVGEAHNQAFLRQRLKRFPDRHARHPQLFRDQFLRQLLARPHIAGQNLAAYGGNDIVFCLYCTHCLHVITPVLPVSRISRSVSLYNTPPRSTKRLPDCGPERGPSPPAW